METRSRSASKLGTSTRRKISNICVFCGSNSGNKPEFTQAAVELGKAMAKRKLHLIYGGGNLGLMGAVSRTVQEGGCQVLGITAETLAKENLIGKTNGEQLVVSGIPEQISEMVACSDAFIALPGGMGTLEEIFTITSWQYLNIHRKPIGLLNVEHFYDFLLVFLEDVKRLGFTTKSSRDIFFVANTADELIDQLEAYEPKVEPEFARLDWSTDRKGKKIKIDLNLTL